jgi:hypothetical protein
MLSPIVLLSPYATSMVHVHLLKLTVSASLAVMQERERLEATQEAKRQKLESVPRALHRLYQ